MDTKPRESSQNLAADRQRQMFRSVSKEEFERLPRPSAEAIQRALDEGRPEGGVFCSGASTPRLDPTLRFF